MLIELRCDKFKCEGKLRPPIHFGEGLNTILGAQTADNSIGKSTFLMIIDFAFGGKDYLLKSTDVQAEVGAHTIKFAFKFGEKVYYFSRNTVVASSVHICNEEYEPTGVEYTIDEYTEFLKEQYHLDLPHLTFRDAVGRYTRVYGRENLMEKKPLYYVRGEREADAIAALMKLHDLFAVVYDLREQEKNCREEKTALAKAQKFNLIPAIKNKTQFKKNEKEIAELERQLRAIETGNEAQSLKVLGVGGEEADKVVELKKQLASARRQRSRLKSRLYAVESNLDQNSVCGFDSRKFADTSLGSFAQFFPESNLKKLEQIDGFHRQLQLLLNTEFAEAKSELTALIELADTEITRIEREIAMSGIPERISKATLEKYSYIDSKMHSLKRENDAYTKLQGLKDRIKLLTAQLIAMLSEQLKNLGHILNTRMDEINTFIYDETHISPEITISENGKTYNFETPKDKGTGAAYKGLIVFDLAVLEMTLLPILVHDSVLFKHIADAPLEKIFERYATSKRQIFVTIDKESSYSPKMREIIKATKVLELSDDDKKLFGRSWNKKEEATETQATETEENQDESQ